MTKLGRLVAYRIEAISDSYDGILYHYTSAEGLRSILDSSELWLTNAAFVNDTTEGKAIKNEKDLFQEADFEHEQVKSTWKRFIANKNEDDDNYYIISLTKKPDMLEQWRAYGSYCIGFDANKLVQNGFILYECIYSREDLKKWFLNKQNVLEWNRKYIDDRIKRFFAFNLIYTAGKKYKNKHYENEQEFRLMAVSHHSWEYPNSPGLYDKEPPIHFRDHPVYKIPVPYVKFFVSSDRESRKQYDGTDMTEQEIKAEKRQAEGKQKRELLPIKEIIIGPMQQQKEAELACRIMLTEKGYKKVKVVRSEIPYRGY